jgi:uncharacterized YkwD family protein
MAAPASYTVTGNDTMWLISEKYGITLDAMIKSNPHVANPNIIWPGLVLKLPSAASGTGSGTAAKPGTSGGSTDTGTTPSTTASFAGEVVTLVNLERTKAGLKPLASDSALSAMALNKAKDMYNKKYFDHTSPTYGSPFDMMKAYGIRYTYAGENIAKGQRTPQEVMTAWMNSAGHRQNILSPNFTKIGTAYYNGEWVQEFIAN